MQREGKIVRREGRIREGKGREGEMGKRKGKQYEGEGEKGTI